MKSVNQILRDRERPKCDCGVRKGRQHTSRCSALKLNKLMRTKSPWEQGSDPDIQARAAAIANQNGAARSKATTSNPKDLFGKQKISFTKVSALALAHCAMAMMDGAEKYGPYNWRAKPVIASIYVDAALRHLYAWFEGEEVAEDSLAHHLGHAMACCAILLDAQEHGVLIDDRPNGKAVLSKLMTCLAASVKQAKEAKAAAVTKTTRRK